MLASASYRRRNINRASTSAPILRGLASQYAVAITDIGELAQPRCTSSMIQRRAGAQIAVVMAVVDRGRPPRNPDRSAAVDYNTSRAPALVHILSSIAPSIAATPVRDTSTRPSGRIRSMNWLILAELPVISNTKLSVVASITRARNASRPAATPRLRCSPGATQLHHRQFALDRAAGQRHIDDAIDRDHA